MKKERIGEVDKSLKILASASFIIFVTTILSKFLTYLYRIVIARHYTPEVYGVYSISLMVVSWIAVFAGFGFAGGLNRYIPYYRGKNEENKSAYLLRQTLKFLIVSGIIGCLMLIFLSGFVSVKIFHTAELRSLLIIFSLSIPLSILAGIFFSVLKSYEKIGWFAFIVNILQNSVKLLALILLIYLGFGSKSIAISYVLSIAIVLLASYFVSKKNMPWLFTKQADKKEDKSIMNNLLSYSWPLIFSGFIASILSWTDTFMIGVLRTPSEVGFYNAAVPIALIITLSTDLFRQILLPLITKEYGNGNIGAVREITRQVTKWLLIISIPLFTALFVFPEEAIRILFGAEYLPAANALRILSIGFFIASVLDVSPDILSMKGMSKTILVDTVLLGLLNAVLNYLLIPIYGINGAAFSTTLSISALSIVFTYQAWKSTSILIIKQDISRVLFSGVIAFAATLITSLQFVNETLKLAIGGVVFVLVYALMIYMTHSVDKNDSMIIKAIKGKLARVKNKGYRSSSISEE